MGNQKSDENNLSNSALVIRTNYEGPSLFLGEIANHFEKRGYGSIIGISSVRERGRASNYIYGSAKSGFTAFLSSLRNRLYKSNVNVLSVLPGFVNTKMTHKMKLPNLLLVMLKKFQILSSLKKGNLKQYIFFHGNL